MSCHRMLLAGAGGLALAVAAAGVVAQDKGQVEVLPLWTSGGEKLHLNAELRFEQRESAGRTCPWPAAAASRR